MKNKLLAKLATGLFVLAVGGMANAQNPVQVSATPDRYENLEWDTTYTFTIPRNLLESPRQFENDSGYLFISETNGNFNNPPNEVVVVYIDGVYFGSHTFFREDEWNDPIGVSKMLAIPLDYTDLFYLKNAPGSDVKIEITPQTSFDDLGIGSSLTSSLHTVWIGYNRQYTIDDVIDFIVEQDIHLDIEGNPGKGQLKAFQKILKAAKEAYDSGDLYTTCDLLQDAADRSDGDYSDSSPEDLIVDSSDENDVQKVFNILSIAIATMQQDQQYCGL